MFDIMPAITFIMAIIFGLEKVETKDAYSQAKIIGTIITLGGVTIMTLYKGSIVEMIWTTSPSVDLNWIAGTLMLLGSCISWSSFFILQSFTLREYPAELSLSSMIVFSGMVQGAAVALVMERNLDAWVIGYDSRLLAPICSGTIGSAFAYYVQGVVLKERGPVFVTAFNPLSTIIVAVLGSLILAEELHLGSYIGAIVIFVGLYLVIWGKTKDQIVPAHGIDNSIFGSSIAAADHPPLEPNSPMLQEPLV